MPPLSDTINSMSVPLEVRFQRALNHHKTRLLKWDFDPVKYPFLLQIQERHHEIFERSFGSEPGHVRFYLDFVALAAIQAAACPDPEEPIIFIALSRGLVDALLELSGLFAASGEVRRLVGVPGPPSCGHLADGIFFIGLEFFIAHEMGHCVLGHVTDQALWFEYSELDEGTDKLPQQSGELDADEYAIKVLCRNFLEGETGTTLANLLPPGGTYGDKEVATLLALAISGVFLMQYRSHCLPANLAKAKHPPLVVRHHRAIEVMRAWATRLDTITAAIKGPNYHATLEAARNALPSELKKQWDEQAKRLASPTGQQYLADFKKFRGG